MKHPQLEKNSMYKKMIIFFTSPIYSIVWANFPRLVKEIAKFLTLNQTLSDYMQQHQTENGGITTVKHNAFMNMINEIVCKSQLALVWAEDEGNEQLIEIFDVQKTDFIGAPEAKALTKAKNIRDNIVNNIGSMASVQLSATDISSINNVITEYEKTIGSIGAAQAHKSIGTSGVEATMKPIDKSLITIDNLLVNTYKTSNPELVNEYIKNRQVDKLPTHHAGITIHVIDDLSKDDLKDVVLALNGITTISNIDGYAEIIKMRPGSYLLTVSLHGYVSQNIKVVVEKARISHLEIIMVKGV